LLTARSTLDTLAGEPLKERCVRLALLTSSQFCAFHLMEALLVHPDHSRQRQVRRASAPDDLQVGDVQVQVAMDLLLQASLTPNPPLLLEKNSDVANYALANPYVDQGVGDPRYLARRDPAKVHLACGIVDIAGQQLVLFASLGYELAVTVARGL
jgi:hypothetical protein